MDDTTVAATPTPADTCASSPTVAGGMESLHRYLSHLRFVAIDTPFFVLRWVGLIVGILLVFVYFRYKKSIRKHLKKLDAQVKRGLVYRDKKGPPSKVVKVLELHPKFRQDNKEWQMCSLGEYLTTLRFITDDGTAKSKNLPTLLERELQVAIGTAILQSFGPRIGGAMLPLLGVQKVESFMGQLVSRLLSWIIANVLVEVGDGGWDPIGDKACLPFNVSELISFVNLNQKIRSAEMEVKPIEWMSRGEIGFDPTYYTAKKDDVDCKKEQQSKAHDKILIPNPFVVEEHFEAAISGLEERIHQQEEITDTAAQAQGEASMTSKAYDPNDTSLAEPTPINQTILPGLHLGWGDAKCTHTKREILRNRLFAVLLTKLSYNYQCRRDNKEKDCFVVRMNGKDCLFPDEFIEALIDSGHTIEVCPRSAITTFGMACCVKEDDGSWTNVPIAFFLRTGYERTDQRPTYFSAPHGGIDMKIEGPLVGRDPATGKSLRCDIQFYMAIEGLCAWHSNHNVDVPWIKSTSTTKLYTKEETLKAVRMSGLLACTFNTIGSEMNLPFGGYGVLGVCNDTAAIVDFAVRGTTNMYPLLSTGRFLMHTADHLMNTCEKLSTYADLKVIVKDARRLASAACFMESDIHCSPTQLLGAVRRFDANYPESFFQITDDSREILHDMSKSYEKFLDNATKGPRSSVSEVAFKDYLVDRTSFQEDIEDEVRTRTSEPIIVEEEVDDLKVAESNDYSLLDR